MYWHNLCRINYTSYDVRRGQDIVNPRTDHRNIMLLSDSQSDADDTSPQQSFLYAQVLGIYHVNAVYIGPGSLDYNARRVEVFRLDTIRFVPMAKDHAFGCHLIPVFAEGRLHPDGIAMSHAAQDGMDWKMYYVNRSAPLFH
ncbi:hypothetical protein BV22DRAFT_1108297 [Leucogyrophana mollusca]|uniref:Uncharacterized protein n=1 Tax=Leucogyrophana mollusca TaxID=85980 RepID=A0ACB8AZ26_9AGAM|nr:hypothetical protein BV22DRAFT_1108297 [Leucogyrophana mollusca]